MDDTTKPNDENKAKALARVETSVCGLVLHTLEDMKTVAQLILQSKLAPPDFDTAEKIFVGLQTGAEIGLKPMQSLNSIVIINGKPVLWGDAALALVKKSGLSEYCHEYFELHGKEVTEKDFQYPDIKLYPDDLAAVCETKRKGEDEPVVRYFSVADAKLAGLWGKKSKSGKLLPWSTHPKRMLKYKARAFNLRDSYPDVLYGMHLAEEMVGEEPLPAPESDVLPRDQRRSLATPSSTLTGERKPVQEAETVPEEKEKPEAMPMPRSLDGPCGGRAPAREAEQPETEIEAEPGPTGPATDTESTIAEKGDLAALFVDVNGMYIAQNGKDFIEFAAYVLCIDEDKVDSPSKFTEDMLKQIKAYIETNGVAIN